jgi:hypothetical protein
VGKTIGDTRRTTVSRNVEDEEAAGAAARATCDEGTLRATYLTAYDGVDVTRNQKDPFAGAELEWYDGKGNIKGIGSSNSNGTITPKKDEEFSGTYTVEANCTGTSTYRGAGFEYKYRLFIDPGGDMFTFVQTDPKESVASGVEQRVTLQRVGD